MKKLSNPLKNKFVTDTSIDTGAGVAGATTGFLIGNVPGAIIGGALTAIFADVGKRLLSPKERNRMDTVYEEAKQKIEKKLADGATPRKDVTTEQLNELTEGTFLTARQSYQEKKLPLLSNLIATAPFTNTSLENLNQSLSDAQELSYRKLCILSVIGTYQLQKMVNQKPEYELSDKSFSEKANVTDEHEYMTGVVVDIISLLVNGFIVQMLPNSDKIESFAALAPGGIVPNLLQLSYPARLLFNGMGLDTIPASDLQPVIKILS